MRSSLVSRVERRSDTDEAARHGALERRRFRWSDATRPQRRRAVRAVATAPPDARPDLDVVAHAQLALHDRAARRRPGARRRVRPADRRQSSGSGGRAPARRRAAAWGGASRSASAPGCGRAARRSASPRSLRGAPQTKASMSSRCASSAVPTGRAFSTRTRRADRSARGGKVLRRLRGGARLVGGDEEDLRPSRPPLSSVCAGLSWRAVDERDLAHEVCTSALARDGECLARSAATRIAAPAGTAGRRTGRACSWRTRAGS